MAMECQEMVESTTTMEDYREKKKKKHTQVESMIVEPMMGSASEGRIQRWVVPKVLPMIDGREGPRWAEFSREY